MRALSQLARSFAIGCGKLFSIRFVKTGFNASILCLLLALAYWGHHSHWKLPAFSQLTGRAEKAAADIDVTVPESQAPLEAGSRRVAHYAPSPGETVRPQPATLNGAAAVLPPIRFASAEVARKSGIQCDPVEQRGMDQFILATGVVDYDETKLAHLSARVSGVVWRVEKRMGERLQRGDVLALIDSAEVGRAKADYLEAVVQCNMKEQTVQRLRSLGEVVAGRRVLEAETEWRAARIRRLNARQRLATMGLPVRLEESSAWPDEQLASYVQLLGLPKSVIASLGGETLSSNLVPLISPMDGVVIRRQAVTGEVVEPNETLFVIADVSRMWLRLNVRAEDVHSLALGQSVQFSTAGTLADVPGTLTWIGTEVDPRTRTVQARAEVVNPAVNSGANEFAGQWLLRANSYGTARIRVRENPLALAVPSSAVRWMWHGSFHVAFVPDATGTRFQPFVVRPGVTRDGYTEILQGLHAGQPVVTSGSRLLSVELAALLPHSSQDAEAAADQMLAEAADAVPSLAEPPPDNRPLPAIPVEAE